MIGATLIGIGSWLVTRGFDYTLTTDYFYALLYIVPGILAVLLSLVGIIGTLGMWYRVHTWVSCYNYPLVLESFKGESLQISPSIDHCFVVSTSIINY